MFEYLAQSNDNEVAVPLRPLPFISELVRNILCYRYRRRTLSFNEILRQSLNSVVDPQVKESLESSRKASVWIKQISISLITNLKTLQYKQQARYKFSYIVHAFSEEL